MSFSSDCCVLSGTFLWDGPITRAEESYQVLMCQNKKYRKFEKEKAYTKYGLCCHKDGQYNIISFSKKLFHFFVM